jgi:hypothetical protein
MKFVKGGLFTITFASKHRKLYGATTASTPTFAKHSTELCFTEHP